MTAPHIFKCAPAYSNPEQAEKDKAVIQNDAWGCYDHVRRGNYKEAQAILLDWSLHCSSVFGGLETESEFIMCRIGQLFLESWLLMKDMDWNRSVFPPWVSTVYAPTARFCSNHSNNWGSWGILGCTLSEMVLGRSPSAFIPNIDRWFTKAVLNNGSMPYEIARDEAGPWYIYFALAPLWRACELANYPDMDRFLAPLNWYWKYVQDPQSWPYRSKKGFWDWLRGIFGPHSKTLETAKPNNWPAELYLVAGRYFHRQDWIDYAQPWPADPPFPGSGLVYRWAR